jgi:hypothetical protein
MPSYSPRLITWSARRLICTLFRNEKYNYAPQKRWGEDFAAYRRMPQSGRTVFNTRLRKRTGSRSPCFANSLMSLAPLTVVRHFEVHQDHVRALGRGRLAALLAVLRCENLKAAA